ncbi:TIGR04463 family radical SAM/SPASM RiPP maturase [Streptomyces sp. STR69]|uniref:TIGR04463 family radical SAM/SPASM RiPP maturase n=1 Tax=Streptomyces sp. STR69 TaxID=1796942 RepID=UPI0021C5EC19|nr:TIGR04463 family radical SAM/SPASM RiPP maturase [Streptomyces sp. STR69]
MTGVSPSRYNVIIPLRRGRSLVFNSLSGATAVLEKRENIKLRRLMTGQEVRRDAVLKTLLYGGFAVEGGVDELEAIEDEYRRARFDPSTMVLTIAPTLGCNFGCDYCFQGIDKPFDRMPSEVQDEIVSLIVHNAPTLRNLSIAWYGGEPLLALPEIMRMSERFTNICEIESVQYDSLIVTNGYRLTEEVANQLHQSKVQVAQVTIDGAKAYHDKRRILLGGQGTFERIVSNITGVVNSTPLRVVIRVNIDSRNKSDVPDLLHFFHDAGLSHRSNFSVYFAPVEAITEGCHSVADQCISKSGYAELETDLQHLAFDLGLASLPYPKRFRGLCGAMRPKGFVVVPNGDVHKCWDTVSLPQMKIGTIFDLDAARTSQIAQEWAEWTPFNNASCRSCKLLPNCAGNCAHKFINPQQTLGEAGALPCPSWKYQLKERVVSLAIRQGAICESDFDDAAISTDPTEICSVPPPEDMIKSSRGVRKLLPLIVVN